MQNNWRPSVWFVPFVVFKMPAPQNRKKKGREQKGGKRVTGRGKQKGAGRGEKTKQLGIGTKDF